MSALDVRVTPEVLRSIDSATFTGSYQALGTPLANGIRLLKIVNDSTVLVTVSYNGTNDHDILPSGTFFLYDFSSNREISNQWELPVNTQVWVKGGAGTGYVYLAAYYAS